MSRDPASTKPGLPARGGRTLGKLIALLSILGVVTLVGFACVPPPPPPQVCTNGVLNPVPFLKAGFYPMEPYDQSPEIDPTSVNPAIQSDLAAAFQAAPPFFKAQLCGLRGIYINPTGCTGYDPSSCANLSDSNIAEDTWGFRARNATRDGYIAISLGLWKNNICQGGQTVCVAPLQIYETRRLLALLDLTAERNLQSLAAVQRNPPLNLPAYAIASGGPTLTVLAALAHEYGHILWWNTFVEPGAPQVSNTAAWQGIPVAVPERRWVHFGDIAPQPPGSDVEQLRNFLRAGNYSEAFEHLHLIYANGRWASALAAFSPMEDFVETYELVVLTSAGLRKSAVTTYGRARYSDSVVRDLTVPPFLRTKLQCFASASPAR